MRLLVPDTALTSPCCAEKRKHWRQVAAASGWDPSSGLKNALLETVKTLF